eukprot:c42387_g1_i1.p2 GENE.c42387_g1_i1~~c42387_g1_i1.p2  ORF type:complete len:146 (+),score=37.02 c42387_g1_i1:115-552(+)
MKAFLICAQNHVLFSKFWVPLSDHGVAEFQQELFDRLQESAALQPGAEGITEIDGGFIVYSTAGTLMFILCGSPPVGGSMVTDDELLLSETLALLIESLNGQLRRLTDECVSQYDKIVLVVDAVIQDGLVVAHSKAEATQAFALA